MAVLYIVGTGPGSTEHLTGAARQAIADSSKIIGYDPYIEQIRELLDGKEILSTGMMQEIDRCRAALEAAANGYNVALVSGGDSGIYGMAGLVFELLEYDVDDRFPLEKRPEVQVIPGISAVQAAASRLGAPLMHDFAVISLSDLLTPWELIKKRLAAAAAADFVIALYNPRSKKRVEQLDEACRIVMAVRSEETPVGIVRHACRTSESVIVTTLGKLPEQNVDMSSLVIIGNNSTFIDKCGRIVTPRGYAAKKELGGVGTEVIDSGKPVENSRAIMICGTASDVGKSVLTAGICRLLLKKGVAVAPFKSQNMSLNSYITPGGGEIGRAQAVQAEACDINPHTDMNPILLKPNSDTGSQIIVQGKVVGNMNVAEYDQYKPTAFEKVWESFDRLKQSYEFIAIEGAGSISEINLKHNDIANLKIAMMARCPVILVADIDRGGVFAQIAGTIELLEPFERSYIKGIIINKFRGDRSILDSGIDFISKKTGIPVLGVIPWMTELALPAEDSVTLGNRSKVVSIMAGNKKIHIGVLKLPRISNFSDFDPLEKEPDVVFSYVEVPEQVAGLDLLIIPGSKSTIADLYFLMERGIYDAIKNFKGHIIGVCGGYQMLGERVLDPQGFESQIREAQGLGILQVETELLMEKETHQALAYLEEAGHALVPECNGVLTGYEIHMGNTVATGPARPFARIFRRGENSVSINDGSVSGDGRAFGTYLHGIFDNVRFREMYLNRIRHEKGMPLRRGSEKAPEHDPFDQLAEHLEKHLDMEKLYSLCGFEG